MDEVQALMALAREVSESGNCVLQVVFNDGLIVAQLFPVAEDFEEWEDEEE